MRRNFGIIGLAIVAVAALSVAIVLPHKPGLPVDTICGVSTNGTSTTIELTHGKRLWVPQKYDGIWMLGETLRIIQKDNQLVDFRAYNGKLDPNRFKQCNAPAYTAASLPLAGHSQHIECGAQITGPGHADVLTDAGVYRGVKPDEGLSLGLGDMTDFSATPSPSSTPELQLHSVRDTAGVIIEQPKRCTQAGTHQLAH